MTWGESRASYGWGNHTPSTGREVAAAFFAGRKRKRSNCETDGREYKLFGNVIARRIPPEELSEVVADRIVGKNTIRPLEFTWADWPTKTTARHLSALGLRANCYGIKEPVCWLQGKRLPPGGESRWWTLKELEELVSYEPPPKPRREPRFINLTGDLFDVSHQRHQDS
jgi:hypothetical protein